MRRPVLFALFYAAIFLQAGAYGLTFLLPDLFATFGADEKTVGQMLLLTAAATLIAVYFSGHLSDLLGRVRTLALACLLIALSLALFGAATATGPQLMLASITLGAGWGLTYALPPVVLTGLTGTENRVRVFAGLSVFVMAGFGLAPVMAAALLGLGLAVAHAFYVTAALCTLSALIFFALIAPIRDASRDTRARTTSSITLGSVAAIARSRARIPVLMIILGASVFAGVTNFQTVLAQARGLDYSTYFLTYTLTVIACRLILIRRSGGKRPYLTIMALLSVMCASVILFLILGGNPALYILFAMLFGIGYGASYPILVAVTANDADPELVPQTLQLFALTYFIGIFGFPLVAGWMLVELGPTPLLVLVAALAAVEAGMAGWRVWGRGHA